MKEKEIEQRLRTIVKRLFAERKIDVFVGYGLSTVPGKTSPIFVTDPAETDKLAWNQSCVNNLAAYLPRFFARDPRQPERKFPRVGIAAKGCDGRAIVNLIIERQVPREKVHIIGMICEGMAEDKNGKLEKKESCRECQYPAPPVYDQLIGDQKSARGRETARFKRIEDFRKKPLAERWEYFLKEMKKCIRCYACRQVCPNCYCPECFTEETQPKWQGVTGETSDVIYYHLGRLFHQAGRCLDCGSCSWVCPMGIDLRLFLQGLVKDVKELYGFEAGLSPEDNPPLSVFKPDDKQTFITEP